MAFPPEKTLAAPWPLKPLQHLAEDFYMLLFVQDDAVQICPDVLIAYALGLAAVFFDGGKLRLKGIFNQRLQGAGIAVAGRALLLNDSRKTLCVEAHKANRQ